MNTKALCLIVLFSLSISVCASSANRDILESSVGKILLSHDKMFRYASEDSGFNHVVLYDEFSNIYKENIQSLAIGERIEYFWFAMWHLNFDGHIMMQFQELLIKDCGNEFILKLKDYIDKESVLIRNKSRLKYSKKVLRELEHKIRIQKN
jgi:hypothetical protein